MSDVLLLSRYSIGVGDRFAHQAKAQLRACMAAAGNGVDVIPVWNKSHREHAIIGSEPGQARAAAAAAVRDLGWPKPWHVDADHINLSTVDLFLAASDFFTLDVAASIGKAAPFRDIDAFLGRHPELVGRHSFDGLDEPFEMTADAVRVIAAKYLVAVQEAGAIYRHITSKKDASAVIAEISMDETDLPQTPPDLLVILAAIADEKIPAQTIAPKFTGRFNKGVDYVGDIAQFEREINGHLAVIAHAVRQYGLPANLKLSVHSGSDKFSLYPVIRRAIGRFDAGVHLKTAGTTWLEELIGLAEAGGDGLALSKEVYREAFAHRSALCAPYAAVIDIDERRLPAVSGVDGWSADQFAGALRHDQSCAGFNPHFRQLLHVGYKVAAAMGDRYLNMLTACEESISRNVTENLLDRHIRPLFLGN